jgi:hypothetical protein
VFIFLFICLFEIKKKLTLLLVEFLFILANQYNKGSVVIGEELIDPNKLQVKLVPDEDIVDQMGEFIMILS